MMDINQLVGAVGKVSMTLEITRAATGKTETVELVGIVGGPQTETPTEDATPKPSAEAQKDE